MDIGQSWRHVPHMRHAIRLLTCSLIATALSAEDGGRLQRARDEVRPKAESSKPSTSSSSGSHSSSSSGSSTTHYHDDSSSGGLTLFGWLFSDSEIDLTPAPNRPAGPPRQAGILRYPFADDQRGWLISGLDDPADPTQPATVRLRPFGGAVRGEYTDGSDGLHRWAGAAQCTFSVLRVEAELHRYLEHLPGDRTDSLTIATGGVALALPLENAFTLLLGAGLSNFHDAYGNESGWYCKAGAEMYPIRPLILNAEVWGGYIRADEYDSETFLGGGRATAGVIWNRIEVFGGWQAIWIESVTLDGPTAGLRIWF